MATTNPYEKYLERLKDRKSESPALRASQTMARSLTPEFKKQQRGLEVLGAQGRMTEGAMAQAQLDIGTKKAEVIGGIMQEASEKDIIRRETIQSQIDEIQMKSDEWEELRAEQEEAERQQGLASTIKTIGTVGGAIAGTFLGSTAVGAKLGAGLGTLIGGAVTDDEYVNDLNALASGISDIGLGVASGISLHSEAVEMKANTDLVSNIAGLNPQDFDALGLGMDKEAFMGVLQREIFMSDDFDAEAFIEQWGLNNIIPVVSNLPQYIGGSGGF